MRNTAHWLTRALLTVPVAGVTYAVGVWNSHLLDLAPTSDYCSAKPLGEPPITWAWLPLVNRCHYSDGTVQDLVPGYVNPVLFLCLAAAVACCVLAVRAARRNRTPRT